MSEPQRLFFALWPDQTLRWELVRLWDRLPARGRRVHPEDLHVTLVFLGDVSPERRACAEQVAEMTRGRGFDLTLDRLGSWPQSGILWCGAVQAPASLLDLVHGLQEGLRDCAFTPESRPYVPHVTLARQARPLSAQPLSPPLIWSARDFALVASHQGEPPHYQVLRRWPLLSDP